MKTPRFRTVFLTFDEKSCVNFNILGRTQKYFAMYRFLNSLYSSHCKTKWYSSSRLLQNLHFRFSKSVFSGLVQRPVSTSSLWDDILKRDRLVWNFLTFIISKYAWYLKLVILIKVLARVEFSKRLCHSCTKLSLILCLNISKKLFGFSAPCASHMSPKPYTDNKVLTWRAQFGLLGNKCISWIIIL